MLKNQQKLIFQIEGATQIIEGVYLGGDVEEYTSNPDYIVREYYGIAAWFGGQLDGELRGDSWTFENNVTAE